jgi:putative transposase
MRTYKTEIILSAVQQQIYACTVGVCRFVYNLFIEVNDDRYKQKIPYINNYAFSKWLNNEYLPDNPDKSWIKDVSSKAVRNAIDNADKAYDRYFDERKKPGYVPYTPKQLARSNETGKPLTNYDMRGHPKYKRKGKNDCNYYFVRTSKIQPIQAERHRIKIPVLGWVRLKEYGYIPTALRIREADSSLQNTITSGTITKQAGRYYISVITDEEQEIQANNTNAGIGIDLGLKTFAVLSSRTTYSTNKQRKMNKKLKREQRKLSRKYEMNKNKEERRAAKGIERQKTKVAKIHQRIANVRNDKQNKIVSEIVRAKPSYITIENLNVRGMMKNRHLSKAIANQGFNAFVNKLTAKAKLNSIEIRIVDRFYPSSKLCNKCGEIKMDLKLSDRVYYCGCGYTEDRDINAAMNLRDAKTYKIA